MVEDEISPTFFFFYGRAGEQHMDSRDEGMTELGKRAENRRWVNLGQARWTHGHTGRRAGRQAKRYTDAGDGQI